MVGNLQNLQEVRLLIDQPVYDKLSRYAYLSKADLSAVLQVLILNYCDELERTGAFQ